MSGVLWVALGGALGSAGRYGVSLWAARNLSTSFPWATFAVNILGSLLIGVIFAILVRKWPDFESARLLLITGVLGGFTTFSAFSMDTVILIERGSWSAALAYVFGSVVLSIGAVALGLWVTRAVLAG